MSRKKKWLRRAALVTLVLLIYPGFVLGYTFFHVLRSDLPGGQNGPLDAYRHTLASAVVAHTLGEWAVAGVTFLFESSEQESHQMDRKNNAIGARLGATCKSFDELEPKVGKRVSAGAERSEKPGEITWLSPDRWRDRKFW